MLKKQLRLDFTELRHKISFSDLSNYSLDIANNLLGIPIWHYSYYHIFLSITEKKELDTSSILSILQGKDKNIILPKMGLNNSLTHYLLTDNTVIKKNKWNVPEPIDGIEVPAKNIEVVFIPLLAFDLNGNRVGYGKGFYDVFLKECKPNVIKVGLSLFEAVEKITDVNDFDIPLDYCVTPTKTYSF